MPNASLLVRFAVPSNHDLARFVDTSTAQDEFPTVLERNGGIARVGKSKLTEVDRETTDDR